MANPGGKYRRAETRRLLFTSASPTACACHWQGTNVASTVARASRRLSSRGAPHRDDHFLPFSLSCMAFTLAASAFILSFCACEPSSSSSSSFLPFFFLFTTSFWALFEPPPALI